MHFTSILKRQNNCRKYLLNSSHQRSKREITQGIPSTGGENKRLLQELGRLPAVLLPCGFLRTHLRMRDWVQSKFVLEIQKFMF